LLIIQRAKAAAHLAGPALLTIALYWPGLTAWFQLDDFAWLGLRWGIDGWRDLAWALFAPHTEGTIRPWSHAGFFLAISSIFGVRALPFHIFVFLNQFVNLGLVSAITRRITGSAGAGFWAAILWAANSALATALSWIMAYNVICCATFILLAFWLFVRYAETGEIRYYIWQFVVFVLGFGALEINLVYPALAGVYALAVNRKLFLKVIPLGLVSVVYTILHLLITHPPATGPYRVYIDSGIFSTLWKYWLAALGPIRLALLGIGPSRWRSYAMLFLIVALAGFLCYRLCRRDWIVLLFPAWFLICLAPMLPFRDQFLMMYLTIPTIGLAMWGGCAVARAWGSCNILARIIAAAALAIYLGVQIPVAVADSRNWQRRSESTRVFVERVRGAARQDPDALVLLTGVNDELWRNIVYYRPWGAYGLWNILLTPESRANIHTSIEPDSLKNFFPTQQAVEQARTAGKLQLLDVRNNTVRDVTSEYQR
jgi:hypothetical protein